MPTQRRGRSTTRAEALVEVVNKARENLQSKSPDATKTKAKAKANAKVKAKPSPGSPSPSRTNSENARRRKELDEVVNNVRRAKITTAWKSKFDQIDTNQDGRIDNNELLVAMKKAFPKFNVGFPEVLHMMKEADVNNDGYINLDEFAAIMENAVNSKTLWSVADEGFAGKFYSITEPFHQASLDWMKSFQPDKDKAAVVPGFFRLATTGVILCGIYGVLYFNTYFLNMMEGYPNPQNHVYGPFGYKLLGPVLQFQEESGYFPFLLIPIFILVMQLLAWTKSTSLTGLIYGWEWQDAKTGKKWDFIMMATNFVLYHGVCWFLTTTMANFYFEANKPRDSKNIGENDRVAALAFGSLIFFIFDFIIRIVELRSFSEIILRGAVVPSSSSV